MKLSLNVGLAWAEVEHLYAVGYRGQTVGKVWFALDRRTEATPWEWHLCIPMTLPDDTKGVARSMDEALQALANALHALILRTPPDRLERAFLLSAATGLNFESGKTIEFSVAEITKPAVTPAQQPAPARAATLAAAVQAIAQGAATKPAAAPTTSAQPPAPQQVAVVKKRMPTVTVKMVTMNKGGAEAAVARPAPLAARPS